MKLKAYFLDAPINVPGLAQGQMVGSFILKHLYPLYLFFSQGLSGVAQRQMGGSFIRKSYVHGINFSLNTGGLIELWIRNNN